MDWTEKLARLKQLDEGKEVGRAKLEENLVHIRSLLLSLTETSEDSGEVFLLTAKAYRLKKKVKRQIKELRADENVLQSQNKELRSKNKKLEKLNKTLQGKVKSLEDENQELKQQIAVLNAFREVQLQEEKMSARKKKNSSMPPDQKSSSSNSSVSKKDGEESSSEEDFDDDNIDTFKVDVEEVEMPKTARGHKSHLSASDSLPPNGRARKTSTIKVHVEKVSEATPSKTIDKRNTLAAVPESKSTVVPGLKEKLPEKEKDGKAPLASPRGGSRGLVSSPSDSSIQTSSSVNSKKPRSATSTRSPGIEKSPSGRSIGPLIRATVDSGLSSSTDEIAREESTTKLPGSVSSETPFDEDTILDIITGLEVTVKARNWENEDKMLIPKDYKYWYQFKVKRAGRELLKFKDFAPKVFYQMRQHWGVSEEAFLKSFEFDNLKPVRGEGKSGAFFIFTKDRQFVLKTATGEERDFLWQILPYYYQYMRRNPNSLLPRFYGVYSMKHEGIGGMTRFIIMNNIFNTPLSPVEKYDLKGSTVGRYVKETKRQPGVILKDLDIVGMGRKLYLPAHLHDEFVRQLKKDSDFLATHKVMDYSLLLGVYYETEDNKAKTAQDMKALTENDSVIKTWVKNDFQQYYNGIKTVRPDGVTEVYYMGVIDILIQFEVKKKLEHLVKSIAYSPDEVSVVEPQFYSKRFFDFITSLLVTDDNEADDDDDTSSDDSSSSREKPPLKTKKSIKALNSSWIEPLDDHK